jgi:two-component system chemotaxis response regulator CheY
MAKILTIEDSAFERKAIVNILAKGGYTDVTEAEDGEQGIEVFKQGGFDLVLLDLRMPGMPGLDVLKKLREIDQNAKVIIISIVRKQETMDEATQLGAAAYITKPVTGERLVQQVQKLVR